MVRLISVTLNVLFFFMSNLLNLEEKGIGLKKKKVWRGFNPTRNGRKSCGVGLLFACIN